MRRYLQRLLPIVLLALTMQILAPIAASWAAAIAASDPLGEASICTTNAADQGRTADQNGQPRTHGDCSICCLAGVGAFLDTPRPVVLAGPAYALSRVTWHSRADWFPSTRIGEHAQARAPPVSS